MFQAEESSPPPNNTTTEETATRPKLRVVK